MAMVDRPGLSKDVIELNIICPETRESKRFSKGQFRIGGVNYKLIDTMGVGE